MGASIRRIDGDNAFTAELFNELVTNVEGLAAYMLGRGVISGLELSDEGGFTLGIAAGRSSNGLRFIETEDPLTTTVGASLTRYVWLNPDTGAPSLTATSADPGGNVIPLGKVITDGSGITSVDMGDASGRVELGRFTDLRTFKLGGVLELDVLNGRLGIGKTPTTLLDVDGELAATQVTTPLGAISVLRLPQVGASPSAPSDAGLFYTKNVGGVAELYYQAEGGLETVLTRAGRPRANAVLYRQTSVDANDTRANSTSELAFASKYSSAANTLRAEQVLKLVGRGVIGTKAAGAGNLTVRLKLGSTTLVSAAIALTDNLANRGWTLEAEAIVRTVGATGTIEIQGTLTVFTAAGTAVQYDLENTATITIDTTATADLGITVQFDTADAANTITQRLLIIESSLD